MQIKWFQQSLRLRAAMTLPELLAVIVVVALVGFLLLPALSSPKSKDRARTKCVNNLKSIALAFRIYATDNSDRFPAAATNGLQTWALEPYSAYLHFKALSNELGSPRLTMCPLSLNSSNMAANFAEVSRNKQIGYFAGLVLDEANPRAILSGDGNLTNSTRPMDGFLTLRTNAPVHWSQRIHKIGDHLALADGSVVQKIKSDPDAVFKASRGVPDRIALPIEP